jgi:hypothetical protein
VIARSLLCFLAPIEPNLLIHDLFVPVSAIRQVVSRRPTTLL